MNDDWIKKLAKTVGREQLADEAWVKSTRARLGAYMSLHPASMKTGWRFLRLFRVIAPAMAAIVLVVMTTLGVAAKNSLPGDTLFPIKIQIEKIELSFLFSSQSRANFEVQRTTSRLKEISALAVQPKATASSKKEAAERLAKQVKSASEQIAKIEQNGTTKALETAVSLHATLQASKDILTDLAPKIDADAKAEVLAAVDAIDKSTGGVQQAILDLQNEAEKNDKTPSGDDLKNKILVRIESAKQQILEIDESANEQVEIKLTIAREQIAVAEQNLANNNFTEAGIRARAAMQAIAEGKALLETKAQLATVTTLPSSSPTTSVASASPVPSATPQPSPTFTATPLPPEALPKLSIEMKSQIITVGEPLVLVLRASNPYRAPLPLKWSSSCQADFAIDAYPENSSRVCSDFESEIYLQPGDSFTWQFASPELLPFGMHTINAEVIGYGMVSYEINVVPHDETAPVLPNQ